MIFGHCHLFPLGLPEKRDPWGLPGSTEHLFHFMHACGFSQAQAIAPFELPPDAPAKSRIDRDGLAWLLAQPHVGLDPDSPLLPVAAINPTLPDALQKLRHARALGVRMLKFHPLILNFDVFSPACEPFLHEANAARMPITWHTGIPDGWNTSSLSVSPDACAKIAARYPQLPILMAHCGTFGGNPDFIRQAFTRAIDLCQSHDNLFLETTAALLNVGEPLWRLALQTLGPHRIIYGRDYPWTSTQMVHDDLAFLSRIGLTPQSLPLPLGQTLRHLHQSAT